MVARHWIYFGGAVLTGVLLVGAGLMAVVDGLSVLAGGVPASEELLLLAALGEAAEWVAVALALGLVAVLLLLAAVVSVLRSGSLPRDDRLVALVERLEGKYPLLRQFDASERVEPTTADRRRELRERYVAGELDDAEFERKLARLLDHSNAGDSSEGERGTTVDAEDRSP
jgi:membrane protein implicated in regulation of membrane protease activity